MSNKREIPTGQRFGELVVLDRAPNPPGINGAFVYTKCDCGSVQRMTLRSLEKRGVSRCQRSSHFDREVLERGNSLVGQRFGALVVTSGTAERASEGKSQARVKCDCGAERFVVINHLLRGNIQSCGGEAHKAIAVQARRWKWKGEAMTYAIEAVGTGLVKIGSARDIKERLLKLQYPCPVEMRVIATCDENIEKRLHQELVEHRAHGEWFQKNDEVMAALQRALTPCELSIFAEIGTGSRGKTRGKKHKCHRCGELGHHAKTCSRPLASHQAADTAPNLHELAPDAQDLPEVTDRLVGHS